MMGCSAKPALFTVVLAQAMIMMAAAAPAAALAAKTAVAPAAAQAPAPAPAPAPPRTPYADHRGRFSIDLPEGWQFLPMPGDVNGASFQRMLEGMPGNAAVRVFGFEGEVALTRFVAQIEAASKDEPGYKKLLEKPAKLGGKAAVRQRFVVLVPGSAKWSKMVEEFIMVHGRAGYVLHMETLAEAFGSFDQDFALIAQSFRIGVPGKPQQQEIVLPVAMKSDRERLVGIWSGGGHQLQLSPSGVVVLDATAGTYKQDVGVLILQLDGVKVVVRYSFEGEMLRLQGGRFGSGISLQRQEPASP